MVPLLFIISFWNFLDIESPYSFFYFTFPTPSSNSAEDNLMLVSYFFPAKKALTFHANCLLRENLHEISMPIFWEKK